MPSDRLFSALINDQIAEFFKIKCAFDRAFDDDIALVALVAGAGDEAESPIVSSARVITGFVTPRMAARPRTVCGGGTR